MKPLRLFLLVSVLVIGTATSYSQKKKVKVQPADSITEQLESGGDFCFKNGDYDCAISAYSQLIKREPKNTNALVKRARVYIQLKDYPQAFIDLNKALTKSPSNKSLIFYELGKLHGLEEDYDKAIENYKSAIRENKQCLPCLENLAKVYNKTYENEKAIQCYKTIIQVAPNEAIAYAKLGLEYMKISQHDSAHYFFNRAANIDSTNPGIYFFRSILFYETNQPEKGDDDIRKAIELDKTIINNVLVEVERHTLGNNLSIAERLLELTLLFDPDNYDIHIQLAKILTYRRNNNEAISSYSKAISIDPKQVEAYFLRGKLYYDEHIYYKALPDFDYYLKHHPENANCLLKRGYCYFKLNNGIEARNSWEMAVKYGEPKGQQYIDLYLNSNKNTE